MGTTKGDSSLSHCACTQGNGEPCEGAGMTQGSQASRQRGGACVLLPALFMNVWLRLACGGECV